MPGTVLGGRYQLDQLRSDATSSTSGMMQFDATDLSTQQAVSVRIVPLANLVDPVLGSTTPADAQAAFERQVEVASGLRHPCIENVLDHGETTIDGDKYVFTVGERLIGGSLREFLDRGRRLTPSQALIVGIDVCRALDAAAKAGVSHGDIRPSRLVFGEDRRVRLVGFGAPLRALDALSLEQANYSAPELGAGGARGASADVYSLALVLIEAMTGEVPFAGDTVAAAFANRTEKLLPVNADFGALAQVLERAGRADAVDRYSPREMGQALVQAAENMPRPTPIDIVGGGLFDTDISKPVQRPDLSNVEPIQNTAPQEPIIIRTTPRIEGHTGPIPQAIIDPTDPTGSPLTIGGDDTGPITLDADSLRQMAAEDPTAQVARPAAKGKWRTRIGIALVAAILVTGIGVGAYFTVLNPKNPVPQLIGLTEAEARNQISQFGWGVRIVKQRSDEVAAGQVIRTDPVLGANLAKRSSLTLIVSEGPTLSKLQEFTGLTTDVAKAKIAELGLVVAEVPTPDEAIAVGTVISWTIADQPTLKAGDSVVKGTSVTLNVSSGPAPRTIPDFAKMPVADAEAKLTELGLVVAKVEAGHPEIPAGQVISSDPVAGAQVAKGATVTLTVSKGQQHTLIPSIYGHDLATVRERLVKYGMVVGKVTGNTKRGLRKATIDGKVVRNFSRVIVGKTVDLTFP